MSPRSSGRLARKRRRACTPPCICVELAWGDTVLQVRHLSPPRTFVLGDDEDGVPVVLAGPGLALRAVVPPGADASVEFPGHGSLSRQQALARGILQPCPEHDGALQAWLVPGMRVRLRWPRHACPTGTPYRSVERSDDALHVTVQWVHAAPWRGLRAPRLPGWRLAAAMLATLALHVGLFAWIAYAMPALEDDGMDTLARNAPVLQILPSTGWLADAEEELERPTQWEEDDSLEGPTACGAERGIMGRPRAPRARKAHGVAGPRDNLDPHVARARGDRYSWESSLGFPKDSFGATERMLLSPWGRDDSLGLHPLDARGRFTGTAFGESRGRDGLGQYGAEPLGLAPLLQPPSPAVPVCEPAPGAGALTPSVHLGTPTVTGLAPLQTIRGVVQASAGRFRMCYDTGLRAQPGLRGRVVVSATIGADGQVERAGDGGSDLADRRVVECFVQAFGTLRFPPIEGTVRVSYPIVLSES